jgi:hypothetical protein
LTKAVVILKPEDDNWFVDVATNYTQLNFDYSATSRIDCGNFEYFIANNIDELKFVDFEYTLVIPAGTILGYTYYERKLHPLIEQGYTHFGDNQFYVLGNPKHYKMDYVAPFIDPYNFSATHSSIAQMLSDHSNMCYVIHNEIPVIDYCNKNPIDWAMTVSSGFFINHILETCGFTDNAVIKHIDVSRMSLEVRQYTIEQWDGVDYLSWLDHLYKKYPSMSLFNRGRFTSNDPNTRRMLEHHNNVFGDQWLTHWNRYKQLTHEYHILNISDISQVKKVLGTAAHTNAVIWWDGALKRLPSNLCKTSNDSWNLAKEFTKILAEWDPNIRCFGSDHCAVQFNGDLACDVASEVNGHNTRDMLWKNI